MIWFFIKKNFFDGWENIANIVVPNFLTIGVLALVVVGYLFGFSFNPISLLLIYLMCVVAIACIVVFVSAFGKNAVLICNFESPKLVNYFLQIPNAFRENFKFGLLVGFICVSAITGIPLYIGMSSFFGVILGMILLFFTIILILALQWYLPLKALLQFDFKKTLKKCFIILFDNFAFSIFMALYSAVLFAFSVIMFFTLPGLNGIFLGYVNALRMRLYKYDWLDQHPNLKVEKERKNIPWKALLREDESLFGKKSFKSLFCNWKADHED